jgi:HK97 family phage prohead protease
LSKDKLTIIGYVNVPGRESKPLTVPGIGRVIEVIEQRAFQRAIDAAKKVSLLLDHRPGRTLADTSGGTLKLYEDEVGLRAEAQVTDAEVIQAAHDKKLKGWSFNMKQIRDSIEQRGEGLLPIRRISDFLMDEVSIIKDLNPCYSSMSVETRADGEETHMEIRGVTVDFSFYDDGGSGRIIFDGDDAREIIDDVIPESLNAAFRNRLERTRITS